MKDKIKKILPVSVFLTIKSFRVLCKLIPVYWYDLIKYWRNSSMVTYEDSETKLLANIIRNYHVIEKGLTMPDRRLGFGKERLENLIFDCQKYIIQYNASDQQLQHAIDVIDEYRRLHEMDHYQLPNHLIILIDDLIINRLNYEIHNQIEISKDEYFLNVKNSFDKFSNSRSSIRNYSNEELSIDHILRALSLAKNYPSACNRQTVRTYVYTDKEIIASILKVQGGNRGFGHLAQKLIVMTAELGVFISAAERNQAYVDGGIYAMNLLYSLHFNKVAACILNCSHAPEKDIKMRKICDVKTSEVFIAMISCGNPPEVFQIAKSKRHNLEKVNKVM